MDQYSMNTDTWFPTSSGSGAQAPWDYDANASPTSWTYHGAYHGEDVHGEEFRQYGPQSDIDHETFGAATLGAAELPHGALMSSKVPPAFDGRGSWQLRRVSL